ncbi:MAG: hypothetical protein M1822_000814 [Bathelium mastoideum]|nr:MAG: hypothetical protein M1822_000814 [Bathelium mastoideum]
MAHYPNIEPWSDYRYGGYRPTHIGDKLDNGRYAILNKLGWGGSSTVWLASDSMRENACVAISIARADKSHLYESRLLKKMLRLRSGDDSHPGKRTMLIPLNSFQSESPNGNHFCLVMRFEGQTISRASNRAQGPATHPLSLRRAKVAVRDLALGIDYMHKQGLTHGDLHPANLYLGIPDDEDWTVEKVVAVYGNPTIVSNDTAVEESTILNSEEAADCKPRYRVADAMEDNIDGSLFPGPLKIADFALAFGRNDKTPKMSSGGPFIVPEFNAPEHCTSAADIWLLGCNIYQFLSGFDLMGTLSDPPLKVVHQMMDTLGPPPTYLLESWKSFVGSRDNIVLVDQPSRPLETRVLEICEGNTELGLKERKGEFSKEDISLITSLLKFMLHIEPKDRPTIGQVLEHPAMHYF